MLTSLCGCSSNDSSSKTLNAAMFWISTSLDPTNNYDGWVLSRIGVGETLLKLNEKVQQMVIDDMIQTGHARALLGIEDLEKQYNMAQKVFDEKLSVRETEKLVKKVQKEKEEVEKTKMDKQLEIVYQDLEEKMKQILGTKVSINAKDENKGKIEIEYYNKEDLDRLIDMILK